MFSLGATVSSHYYAGDVRYDEHVQAKERHPRSPISLTKLPARREWLRAIERANVVESQESTFKDVVATRVLAIYPLE